MTVGSPQPLRRRGRPICLAEVGEEKGPTMSAPAVAMHLEAALT
jgi:hypothetical protein